MSSIAFGRRTGSSTRQHGGRGSELSIVKHLVELHGGTIRAESPGANQGATLCLHLPVAVVHRSRIGEARQHPSAPSSAALQFEAADLAGTHVLVVDDGMPDVDGFELLCRVRALEARRGGRIPAIALTAFAGSEDRTQALRAGFLVHIAKPVEPSELVATVASVLGRTSG